MKKLIALILSLIVILGLAGCGNTDADINVQVFKTEDISRILFYDVASMEPVEVPEEYFSEIVTWLSTFTIDKEVENDKIEPGSDAISVQIEYNDGTTVKNGLSTFEIDGKRYYMKSDDTPECWQAIFEKQSELDEPPVLQLVDENNNVVVTCLVSTNEWRADGVSRIADYVHPQQREYGEENTITLDGEKTLYLNKKDAKITDVTLYSVETGDAPYKAEHTENSINLNGTGKNVYFADISTEFEQGTVAYCFKIICGQNIECE